MSYVLVHWDESDGNWSLHDEDGGNQIAGTWPDRPSSEDIYTEMGRDLVRNAGVPEALGEVMASKYYYIRESSDTPVPW